MCANVARWWMLKTMNIVNFNNWRTKFFLDATNFRRTTKTISKHHPQLFTIFSFARVFMNRSAGNAYMYSWYSIDLFSCLPFYVFTHIIHTHTRRKRRDIQQTPSPNQKNTDETRISSCLLCIRILYVHAVAAAAADGDNDEKESNANEKTYPPSRFHHWS